MRKGRVVVASLKESKAMRSATTRKDCETGRMVAVRGKISEPRASMPPGEAPHRGPWEALPCGGVRPCIKAISPVSTTILDPAPVLSWENRCPGDRKVTVKIISGDTVVYSAESEGSSLKVPDKVLAYGNEYRWIVDSGKVNNVSGGVFSLPSDTEAEEFGRKIAAFKERKEDLSFRLSYVFFLVDNNLSDLARAEIKTLKADFPENEHLKKMEESIRSSSMPSRPA